MNWLKIPGKIDLIWNQLQNPKEFGEWLEKIECSFNVQFEIVSNQGLKSTKNLWCISI